MTAEGHCVSGDDVLDALTSAHEIPDRHTILGDDVDEDAAEEAFTYTDVV